MLQLLRRSGAPCFAQFGGRAYASTGLKSIATDPSTKRAETKNTNASWIKESTVVKDTNYYESIFRKDWEESMEVLRKELQQKKERSEIHRANHQAATKEQPMQAGNNKIETETRLTSVEKLPEKLPVSDDSITGEPAVTGLARTPAPAPKVTISHAPNHIETLIEIYRNNLGTIRFNNGHVYTGAIEQGQANGAGKIVFGSGAYYEGTWKDGRQHGQGILVTPGNRYEGAFEHGDKHGYGKHTSTDGTVYEGHWGRNRKNGEGKITHPDGTITSGVFVNNVCHKPVVMRAANGDKSAVDSAQVGVKAAVPTAPGQAAVHTPAVVTAAPRADAVGTAAPAVKGKPDRSKNTTDKHPTAVKAAGQKKGHHATGNSQAPAQTAQTAVVDASKRQPNRNNLKGPPSPKDATYYNGIY